TSNSGAKAHAIDALSRLTAIGADKVYHDDRDNLLSQDRNPVQFTFDPITGNMLTSSNAGAKSTFEYDALDRRRVEHRPNNQPDRVMVWDGNVIIAHGAPDNLTLDVPGDDIDAHIASLDQFGGGSQW